MSIKVYIHYEVDTAPHKTSKMTVPKKWVAEKTVADVIELFTGAYNKANPENAIEASEVHLINNRYPFL
jgi:pyridoxine 5'-phosphate synthase PdxJ